MNVLAGNDNDTVWSAYGPDIYSRLAHVKREFDPGNLFRVNQNVPPERAASSPRLLAYRRRAAG